MTRKMYRPREIAKMGIIRNSKHSENVNSNYEFILKLIRTGKLKAKDYGQGKKPYYLVSIDDARKYAEEWQ